MNSAGSRLNVFVGLGCLVEELVLFAEGQIPKMKKVLDKLFHGLWIMAAFLALSTVIAAELATETEVDDAAQTILVEKPKGQIAVITVRATSASGKRGQAAKFEAASPSHNLIQPPVGEYWVGTNKIRYFRVSHYDRTNLVLFPLPQ